jgi:putative phosphoribosyl transferase
MDPRHVSAALPSRSIHVDVASGRLEGDLKVPSNPRGLVLFAHGSGSSRMSPRNKFVAGTLDRRGFATLLIDLLTDREELLDEHTGRFRFDIEMLAQRLETIAGWVAAEDVLRTLPIGLFGASTGGGAALIAAARRPDMFRVVVSRGGRPDLAGSWLRHVLAPTLLIVGERDESVIAMNQEAMQGMHAEVRLEIVPHATHLFEEPGALERVAELAGGWFETRLGRTEQ